MELYVPESVAQEIIDISRSFSIEAQIIGHIESYGKKRLLIQTPYGGFEYGNE